MNRQDLETSIDTLCAHAGQGFGDGAPLVAPLVASTTFCRDGIESGAEHAYSRVSNPTVAALESVLGRLEGAEPAVCFGSGLAAESALFLALLRQGDHVICGRSVYGGTTRLLEQILSELGVEIEFVDTTDLRALDAALRPTTRLVFVETPANPTLDLTDIRGVAEIAHAGGARLVVDNTFLTPVLQRPLDLGADATVYSTTKFIEGHSAALGGAVLSRDPELTERLRFLRKCTGGIQSPFSAWLTLQGLKTLPLRLSRQSESALRVARWLKGRDEVARVHYPGLAIGAQQELARAQHLGADGAVVSFEVAGGGETARTFLGRLELCRLVEHVGSVETLITHPATMTHADVPREKREAVSIGDGLVRLSVGIEECERILADLGAALDALSAKSPEAEVVACPAAR